jgi:hypothetical protein
MVGGGTEISMAKQNKESSTILDDDQRPNATAMVVPPANPQNDTDRDREERKIQHALSERNFWRW